MMIHFPGPCFCAIGRSCPGQAMESGKPGSCPALRRSIVTMPAVSHNLKLSNKTVAKKGLLCYYIPNDYTI